MSRDALAAELAGAAGAELLARLEAHAESAALRQLVARHYPGLGLRDLHGGGRRRFLSLLAVSLAAGGLAACGRSDPEQDVDRRDRIVPFVRQPTDMVPSAAMTYASGWMVDGLANGAWVTTRNGRPIKLEGNPDHPWTRGGTDSFGQASLYGFYDPDRSQSVRYLDRASDWPEFMTAMRGEMAGFAARHGEGLRLLTPPLASPSLIYQIERLQAALPAMRWHTHAPVGRGLLYAGTRLAFGEALETRWRFDRARVVVAIDGDFLDSGPQQTGASREWQAARRRSAAEGRLLTLHAAAATSGLTQAKADFPVCVPARSIAALVSALASAATGGVLPEDAPARAWVARAGAALAAARGAGIVTIGALQPPELQAEIHRLNMQLGNVGQTVFHTRPALQEADDAAALIADMQAGRVDALVMLDVNPAYATPAALGFADALARVRLAVHAGQHVDETAIRSTWHLPLKHPLESWGDPRALDGTVTILQPTMRPLYGGRSVAEVVSMLAEPEPRDGLALLHWAWQGGSAEKWHEWIESGLIAGTAFPERPVKLAPIKPAAAAPLRVGTPSAGLRLLVRPDPTVWDGTEANNGWLQELPKPLTKVTWSNYAVIGPGLARKHGFATGDRARLRISARTIDVPVWVTPEQADDCVTVTLGYGRQAGGAVAEGLGFDAYALLPPSYAGRQDWETGGLAIEREGAGPAFALTQMPDAFDPKDIVRVQTVGEPPVGDDRAFTQPTFYDRAPDDGRSWGMVIDIDACTGCNACVVACQAENNIPVVGAEQVRDGRDMHWLRVDRYEAPETGWPGARFVPVPCMHCENAPCELGCPVEATLHDHEGLNLQIYNRCIGTRACSSYCPYKVRHFNYLDYTADTAPSLQAQFNPDVTVRARGVMEKCTYCVQRIVAARIASDESDRPIAPDSVQTACAQACPTQAIVFGDMKQSASAVAQAKRDPRHYALLGELNTRPHTTYLAALAPRGGEG